MDAARRRRSAQTGTITKICKKPHHAQAEDEASLVIPHIERHLTSLASSFEAYKAVHQKIAEGFADTINLGTEDEALEQQTDIVEEAELLGQLLLSIATTNQDLFTIRSKTREIECLMGESPSKSYLTTLTTLAEQLKDILDRITRSSIPPNNDLNRLLIDVSLK